MLDKSIFFAMLTKNTVMTMTVKAEPENKTMNTAKEPLYAFGINNIMQTLYPRISTIVCRKFACSRKKFNLNSPGGTLGM